MHEMVLAVRDEMQAAYSELKESAERVAKVVLAEELQFARVMDSGSELRRAFVRSRVRNAEKLIEQFAYENDFAQDTRLQGRQRASIEVTSPLNRSLGGRARHFESPYAEALRSKRCIDYFD